VCGDGGAADDGDAGHGGSPPRVRGRHLVGQGRTRCAGLTPACAGTASQLRHHDPLGVAHPRVCGDGNATAVSHLVSEGSPPRVRGRRPRIVVAELCAGLTPACAGTAPGLPRPRRRGRAHPRVCGDGGLSDASWAVNAGSPPRVRGRHTPTSTSNRRRGLTPACAGTASAGATRRNPGRAHPRVCGDGIVEASPTTVKKGSPPRVRGRLAHQHRTGLVAGLTPACAGTAML